MNTFVIFFLSACFVTLALADDSELAKQKNAAAEVCKKELNADDTVTSILHQSKVPENEAQSCFLDCVYGKLNLIKDGKLNKDEVQKLIKTKFGNDKDQTAKAEVLFQKCGEEVAKVTNEKCGSAKVIRNCLSANAGDLPIFSKAS